MSLNALIGLILTAILIYVFISGWSRVSNILDPHYERDIIDSWVEEIQDLGEGYVTEVLPIDDLKKRYFIAIFQEGTKAMSFRINGREFTYERPPTCGPHSCICSYNSDSNQFEYCKKLRESMMSAQLTDTDTYNFEESNLNNGIAIFNKDYWTRDRFEYADTLVATHAVFMQRHGDRINFCFNIQEGACAEK